MTSRDLTKGSVVSNLLYMSVPAMLGMVTQTLYGLVDMMWVGRISASAVAAVTIFGSIYWIVFVLNNTIGNGSVAVLSQGFGSGNQEIAKKATANTFGFKLLTGLAAAVILLLALKPVLSMFSSDPHVIRLTLDYGIIRTIFLPVTFSSFTVHTVLRCSGDAKSPMYITMFTALLNIILDPIFIFDTIPVVGIPGLGLGVFGAALATVISVTISLLIGLWILFGPKSRFSMQISDIWKIDWQVALNITRIGFPPAASGFLRTMTNLIILGFVTTYGMAAVAAWGIIGRLLSLMWMPINGIKQGGSAIVGQNIGAGFGERAEKTGLIAGKLGLISMAVLAFLMFITSPQLMSLFTNDIEVISLGAAALKAAMFAMPVFGLYSGVSTLFMGSGNTLPFLIAGTVGQWLFQMPLLFMVVRIMHLPFAWVGAGYIGLAIGEGLVYLYFCYRGNWREKIKAKMAAANTLRS